MATTGEARGSKAGWDRRWLQAVALSLALPGALFAGNARAAGSAIRSGDRLPIASEGSPPSPFSICHDQTYALCAVSACFVFNDVAYCKCDVEHGDSISVTDDYGDGQDVCTANAEGATNGYMISTYSFPPSLMAPGGDQAIYTCPASTSNGSYAQCDGGFCFKSSEANRFPGFTEPLEEDEIICSCPIATGDPETAKIGFQIAGPYPCQESFFANCKSPPAGKSNGDTIYVGSPTGVGRFLTRSLYGSVPPLNHCFPPR